MHSIAFVQSWELSKRRSPASLFPKGSKHQVREHHIKSDASQAGSCSCIPVSEVKPFSLKGTSTATWNKHAVPVRLSVLSYLQLAGCQFQILAVFSSTTHKNLQNRYLASSNKVIADFLYLFSLLYQFTIILCYHINGSVLSEPFSFKHEIKACCLVSFGAVSAAGSETNFVQVLILPAPRTCFYC